MGFTTNNGRKSAAFCVRDWPLSSPYLPAKRDFWKRSELA